MTLGIIAGILGLFTAAFALVVGGLSSLFKVIDGVVLIVLGIAAIGCCILGLTGAGLSLAKPTVAGVLLLIAGGGFILSVSYFAIVSGPLFLIAGLFALAGQPKMGPHPFAAQPAAWVPTVPYAPPPRVVASSAPSTPPTPHDGLKRPARIAFLGLEVLYAGWAGVVDRPCPTFTDRTVSMESHTGHMMGVSIARMITLGFHVSVPPIGCRLP